jgi:hypothetical protein
VWGGVAEAHLSYSASTWGSVTAITGLQVSPTKKAPRRSAGLSYQYQERRSVQKGLVFPLHKAPQLSASQSAGRAVAPARRNAAQYFGLS